MTDIKLLGLSESVYTRIARLALAEKGIEYTFEKADIFDDDGPPEAYLKYHPFGRIPCLIQDEFCLYETGAITRYLDESFSGQALQPSEPSIRARMNQIMGVLDSYGYRPMVWDVFVQRVVIPGNGGQPDEAVIFAALKPIEIVLEQLELWLGNNQFLTGQAISLADLHAYPMLLYFAETPEGRSMLTKHLHLLYWLKRMKERPSVEVTKSPYEQ